jgi:hypothetical protein
LCLTPYTIAAPLTQVPHPSVFNIALPGSGTTPPFAYPQPVDPNPWSNQRYLNPRPSMYLGRNHQPPGPPSIDPPSTRSSPGGPPIPLPLPTTMGNAYPYPIPGPSDHIPDTILPRLPFPQRTERNLRGESRGNLRGSMGRRDDMTAGMRLGEGAYQRRYAMNPSDIRSRSPKNSVRELGGRGILAKMFGRKTTRKAGPLDADRTYLGFSRRQSKKTVAPIDRYRFKAQRALGLTPDPTTVPPDNRRVVKLDSSAWERVKEERRRLKAEKRDTRYAKKSRSNMTRATDDPRSTRPVHQGVGPPEKGRSGLRSRLEDLGGNMNGRSSLQRGPSSKGRTPGEIKGRSLWTRLMGRHNLYAS